MLLSSPHPDPVQTLPTLIPPSPLAMPCFDSARRVLWAVFQCLPRRERTASKISCWRRSGLLGSSSPLAESAANVHELAEGDAASGTLLGTKGTLPILNSESERYLPGGRAQQVEVASGVFDASLRPLRTPLEVEPARRPIQTKQQSSSTLNLSGGGE